MASGISHRLIRSRFRVVITEIPQPTVIRRTVAFAQAVYSGETTVEGITARHAALTDVSHLIEQGIIPVVTDSYPAVLAALKPWAVVDAIIAKRNLGTSISDAKITIAAGPGFFAGQDVHAVIETMRGHDLGRVITHGMAAPDTGIPGDIGGYTTERVLRAPSAGVISARSEIGDTVKKGDIVAFVGESPVAATLDGVLRGMLYNGLTVTEGMKIGDIDPRCKREHCFTISDKARAIGGGVLEALLALE